MNKTTLSVLIASVLFSGSNAFSDDKPWKETAELSVVSTNGNSKGTTISGKDTFTYQWKRSILELNAGGLGSESNDQQIAEQYYGNEKLTWDLIGRNYTFERLGWDKNRFAGILNRYDGSIGLGRHFFDEKNANQFMIELGGGYINEERQVPPRNEFGSGRAYTKYSYAFSPSSTVSQDGEFLHNFKDSDDYRLTTISAVQTALSTHLSLKATYTWKRSGKPPVGFSKDDSVTAIAFIVNY